MPCILQGFNTSKYECCRDDQESLLDDSRFLNIRTPKQERQKRKKEKKKTSQGCMRAPVLIQASGGRFLHVLAQRLGR